MALETSPSINKQFMDPSMQELDSGDTIVVESESTSQIEPEAVVHYESPFTPILDRKLDHLIATATRVQSKIRETNGAMTGKRLRELWKEVTDEEFAGRTTATAAARELDVKERSQIEATARAAD